MVRLTLIASLGCLLSISNNRIKTEVYSAPSSGFLMLSNGTTATKPKTQKFALIPHFHSLPISASPAKSTPQTFPKSICHPCPKPLSLRNYCTSLLTGPLTSTFINHTHTVLVQGLFHIASIVILKTQTQIMSLPCLKLSNISPTY